MPIIFGSEKVKSQDAAPDMGEGLYGEAMAGVSTYSANYNISDGETKTLQLKCNILDTAGNHAVALVFEEQETLGALTGIASEIDLLTKEYLSPLPLNGNGQSSVGVAVTVEGEPEEEILPAVSIVSLPASTLTGGQAVAMRFNIAAPGERVAVRHLTFQIDLDTDSYITVTPTAESAIRETGSGGSNIAGVTRINGGSPCEARGGDTSCILEVGFDESLMIPAGGFRTFDLRLEIGGTLAGSNSVATKLLGDAVARTGRLMTIGGFWDYRVTKTPDNFVWFDMEGWPESQTEIPDENYHWMNGAGINYLPSDFQTMAK